MRILVDVLHPAHVHFFRHQIVRWRDRGDDVVITTRDKDLTHELLDRYGLNYECLSRQQRGWRMGVELVSRWVRMFRLMRRFRPDMAMSISGISTALPARLLRIPNLALTDTEIATVSNRIAFPFATRILTPEWFIGDLGKKHHRYRGLHEWAYLNSELFTPDPDVVRAQAIDPDRPYAVVRLVGWDAVHDRREQGLGPEVLRELIEALSARYRVHLTVEGEVAAWLGEYVTPLDPTAIHDVLAHSALYVGDGATMAVEAALLGTPAVYVSSVGRALGNVVALEKSGMLHVCEPGADLMTAISTLVRDGPAARCHSELLAGLESIGEVLDQHVADLVESERK